jgi:pre-mRNA-splicing helicase BRR2
VAVLTILNELAKHRDPATSTFDPDVFKCVYIVPMKALVQEMVGNFSERLKIFSVRVGELTGDAQMTKQQIAETQLIVTTPEKWDVITRNLQTDTSYTNIVRLIILSTRSICYTMSVVLWWRVLLRGRSGGWSRRTSTCGS